MLISGYWNTPSFSKFDLTIRSWKDIRYCQKILYFEKNPCSSSHVVLVHKARLVQAHGIKNVTNHGRESEDLCA